MVTVEVFDQRRPGRRDPDSSFGTLTVPVADTLDLAAGGHGEFEVLNVVELFLRKYIRRNHHE